MSLETVERDGMSFTGPHHWHVFSLVARKPSIRTPLVELVETTPPSRLVETSHGHGPAVSWPPNRARDRWLSHRPPWASPGSGG